MSTAQEEFVNVKACMKELRRVCCLVDNGRMF